MKFNLTSVITCPFCGYEKEETMPGDACQIIYRCEACRKVLTPKKGTCCVFCSYGSNPCPPKQQIA